MGFLHIRIDIQVPDEPADAVRLLDTVTKEIGSKYALADTNLGLGFHDVLIVDDEGDYDPSDLAFFMLNNRLFSNEAENRIVRIEYDWMD